MVPGLDWTDVGQCTYFACSVLYAGPDVGAIFFFGFWVKTFVKVFFSLSIPPKKWEFCNVVPLPFESGLTAAYATDSLIDWMTQFFMRLTSTKHILDHILSSVSAIDY